MKIGPVASTCKNQWPSDDSVTDLSLIFPSTIIVGLSESEAKQMYSAVMEEFAKFVEQVPGVKVMWDGGCEKWDVVDVEVVAEEEPLDESHAVYWCVVCKRDVNAEHFDDHPMPQEYDGPDEYDVRERTALSSNHLSVDLQVKDAVESLGPRQKRGFDAAYPEWHTLVWSGSWVDAENSGVDPEYTSWVIDWIEANTNIMWEDGEPWLMS